MYNRTSKKVVNLFARIDRKVLSFRADSGLCCPRCSGRCCKTDYIEVTPLDVLPAIMHLKKTGRLENFYKKICSAPRTCIFYSKKQTDIKNCHCRIYLLRPSNCRIFGFGVTKDKHGNFRLAVCKLQKKNCKNAIKQIEGPKKLAKKAASYSDVSMMLYNIEPTWASMHMHINDALKMVSEKILLAGQITANHTENNNRPNHHKKAA